LPVECRLHAEISRHVEKLESFAPDDRRRMELDMALDSMVFDAFQIPNAKRKEVIEFLSQKA
jgi:hypothetical protein